MKAFAALTERLAFEPGRTAKLRLIEDYLRETPDPDRGYALAALTGTLDFPDAKPAMLRGLIEGRMDPELFRLSYDYVGDLAETIALAWPRRAETETLPDLPMSEVVDTLARTSRRETPQVVERWLDRLDEPERFALLKLMTGGLRIGVSVGLAKQALARLGHVPQEEIEEVWHGAKPPYTDLFAWIEGRAERPDVAGAPLFRSPMLAQALDEAELASLPAAEFLAEWKWDGIRVQAVGHVGDNLARRRLYSRTGEDIGTGFPDLVAALAFDATLDGELVVLEQGGAATFSRLQQRLNRKAPTSAQMAENPVGIVAYDLLFQSDEDLRPLPFAERRQRLERYVADLGNPRILLSPLVPFANWEELAAARAASRARPGIEGVMLKRRDSSYVAGRPRGPWFKWKRDPDLVDCVLMYAQRGHGKRSSYYSDYTFGVWQEDAEGRRLVPVGKAYFGFTDAELLEIDRFVRTNTLNRFGPVREVTHTPTTGLVFEVAHEGLQRSGRHKSGIAMRFPRIARIRWDKPPGEADTLDRLQKEQADAEARGLAPPADEAQQ